MQNNPMNNFPAGFISGILLPFVPFFLFYATQIEQFQGFNSFWAFLIHAQVLPKVMTLCVLANLVLFFIALSKEQYYFVRGIMGATAIYGIVIFVIYFSEL